MQQTPEGYLLLGNPSPAEQAMRALELKGDLPQLVDPRFQLGLNLLDLDTMPYGFLQKKLRYVVSKAGAAVAAQHTQFCFVPPPNFGGTRPTLVHIRRVHIIAGATAIEVQMGLSAGGPGACGAFVAGSPCDDRAYGGATASAGSTMGTGNAVASLLPAQPLRIVNVPLNTMLTLDVDYVLTSRDVTGGVFLTSFVAEVSGLNVPATLTMEFDERPLMTSER